jgi:hypothetical protein
MVDGRLMRKQTGQSSQLFTTTIMVAEIQDPHMYSYSILLWQNFSLQSFSERQRSSSTAYLSAL